VFGLSFGELVVVVIVALVVMGPHELPKVLRKLGQWAGKLRRMAYDLRAQSGIDDVLRAEGIGGDLREIAKLARGELDGVVQTSRLDQMRPPTPPPERAHGIEVYRAREYPLEGADACGALPDTNVVYPELLVASAHAGSDAWTCGIADPPPDVPTLALSEPSAAAPGAPEPGASAEPRAAEPDAPPVAAAGASEGRSP
jgi:sec-independent protein translocase protein TatB